MTMLKNILKYLFDEKALEKSLSDPIDVGDRPLPLGKADYEARLVYPHNKLNGRDDEGAKLRAKRAFEFAVDTRRFEIELYWKRASYFWAFITVIFAGYVALIRSEKSASFEAFLLICVGLIVSLAWHLTNKGSKAWQRHWEKHLDLLEDEFMGPLYKTVNVQTTYSVSKINEIVSFVFVFAWVGLAINHLFTNYSPSLDKADWHSTVFVFTSISFVLFSVWQMFCGKGRGRFRAQEIKMYKRGYVFPDKD